MVQVADTLALKKGFRRLSGKGTDRKAIGEKLYSQRGEAGEYSTRIRRNSSCHGNLGGHIRIREQVWGSFVSLGRQESQGTTLYHWWNSILCVTDGTIASMAISIDVRYL